MFHTLLYKEIYGQIVTAVQYVLQQMCNIYAENNLFAKHIFNGYSNKTTKNARE